MHKFPKFTPVWNSTRFGQFLCPQSGVFPFMWPCIVTNFFVIKPTKCTNFLNLLRYETLHVSGSSSANNHEFIHCTFGTGMCHTGLKTAFEQDQDGTQFHPGLARKLFSTLYDTYRCRMYSEWNHDYWQRNCPKRVEFHTGVNLGNLCIWLVLLQRNLLRCTVTWTKNCKTYVHIYCLQSKNLNCHQQLKILCLRWESQYYSGFYFV